VRGQVPASSKRQQRLLERSARARDQGQRHIPEGQWVDRQTRWPPRGLPVGAQRRWTCRPSCSPPVGGGGPTGKRGVVRVRAPRCRSVGQNHGRIAPTPTSMPARGGSGAPCRGPWQGKGDPRRLPPTSEPAGNRLARGALAGSGPGTSPCIGGLSLVSAVIPQRPICSTPTHDDGRPYHATLRRGSTPPPMRCSAAP
jgi:hypothetical protein